MPQNDDFSPLEPEQLPPIWRRWIAPVGGALLVLFLTVLALPLLFNTEWGKGKVRGWVDESVPGSVAMGDVHFSWFGGQEIKHGELRDPAGKVVAAFDTLKTNISPLRLAFSRDYWGHTEIEGLNLNIVQEENGLTNVHRALIFQAEQELASGAAKPHQCSSEQSDTWCVRVPFTGAVSLEGASITLHAHDLDTIVFDQVNAHVLASDRSGPIAFHMKGLSHREGLAGDFEIDCTLSGLDADGRLQFVRAPRSLPLPKGDGAVELKVDMENVAVDMFDQLLTFNNPKFTGVLADALGETLTLRLDNTLSESGAALRIFASSPNLKTDLATSVRDGKLILDRPGRVGLRVTPEFFEHLGPSRGDDSTPLLRLKEDTEIELVLERMNVPTKLADPVAEAAATLRARLRVDQADFAAGDDLGLVRFQGIRGVVERLEASESFILSLDGELFQGGRLASVRLGGKLHDQLAGSETRDGDLNLAVKEVPTPLVDYLMHTQRTLTDTLGDNVDINLAVALSGATTNVKLQLGSDVVSLPALHLQVGERIRLVEPTQLHYQVTPAFVEQILGDDAALFLDEEVPTLFTLKTLDVPTPVWFGGFAKSNWSDAIVDADIASAPFVLSGRGPNPARARFSNVRGEIKGRDLAHGRYALAADVAPDGVTAVLSAALGSVSTIEIEGRVENTDAGLPQFGQTRLSVQSDVIDLRAVGRFSTDKRLVLTTPATLRYKIQPDVLLALGILKPGAPQLTQNIPAEIRLDTFSLDLADSTQPRVISSGRATVGELHAIDPHSEDILATSRDMLVTWHIDTLEREAAFTARAKTYLPGDADRGSIDLSGNVKRWGADASHCWRDTSIHLDAEAQRLPTVFVSAFSGLHDLKEFAGDAVDVTLSGGFGQDSDEGVPGHVELSIKGDGIDASGEFELANETVALKSLEPVKVSWEATPERVEAFTNMVAQLTGEHPSFWGLTQDSTITATVSDISVPWSADTEVEDDSDFDWADSTLKFHIASEALHLRHAKSGDTTVFESVVLNLDSEGLRDSLVLDVSAIGEPPQAEEAATQLSLQGRMEHPFHNGQWFNSEDLDINFKLHSDRMALAPLLREQMHALSLSEQLPKLIGERVSGDIDLQLSQDDGVVTMDLRGDTGHLAFHGNVQDKVLTLDQDLTLEVAVTPELKEGLLRDFVPFMADAIGAEQPLRFTVPDDGVRIPLDQADLHKAQIPRATLELGKVSFGPEGQLADVLKLLDGRNSGSREFTAWFTPLHLSLDRGIVHISRVDALIAGGFPMALWGKVDLIKDRVRLVLGISAEALESAYGIDNLDDSYMLQIPLSGTTSHAEIDGTKATARITALVAHSQGTPEGTLFGGVLDLVGGGIDEWRVPPPSSELPWDDGSRPKPKKAKKATLKKEVQRNLEQSLKKGAKRLFDALK